MGKPSYINPMRAASRPGSAILRGLSTACFSLAILFALATHAPAQTLATTLPLLYPWAIAFDSQGNLYFAETNSHAIRKVTPAGVITTVAGNGTQGFTGDNGLAASAELDSPAGLALDSANNLYIADTHNHRIRKVDAATGLITTIAGTGAPGFSGDNGSATSAQLDLPTVVSVDSGNNLYLADTANHRIRKVDASSGLITTVAGNGTQGFAGDNGPATSASIDSPAGLALDPANNLYLADTHNHRIRKVAAATGIITTLAGTTSPNGSPQPIVSENGLASSATLALPRGLTVDPTGNLYLADSANQRIRRIAPATGTISTVAGQGTQAFAGDDAPAVAASLDTPQSVALSPAGLLTLADTGNARVRQLDQLPTPGPNIHTLAGVGVINSLTLSLTAPATVAYGTGNILATLVTPVPANGSVTFVDTFAGSTSTLTSPALVSDTATLNTSTLSAGLHTLTATYSGDSTHGSAQSPILALTITPLAVTASPNPASILYGQPIPVLTGTVAGVLPQDTGKVFATFATPAANLSPAAFYPITAVLTGPSAGDYTLATASANLTIARAPTVTQLLPSTPITSPGLPVTLNLQVASTTTGTPTGSITVIDRSAPLSTQSLSSTAAAIFSSSTLSPGSHVLLASYTGDTNFLPSTSALTTITIGSPSDFLLIPTGVTSQSIPSGSSATFSFSVQTQGPLLSSPITIAVTGVPLNATASTNPAYLPPGGAINAFTLTIQTPKAASTIPASPFSPRHATALFAFLLSPFTFLVRRQGRIPHKYFLHTSKIVAASCILCATWLSGCGNRVNTGPETSALSYTLTVTGTATSPSGTALEHSASVILQVL